MSSKNNETTVEYLMNQMLSECCESVFALEAFIHSAGVFCCPAKVKKYLKATFSEFYLSLLNARPAEHTEVVCSTSNSWVSATT